MCWKTKTRCNNYTNALRYFIHQDISDFQVKLSSRTRTMPCIIDKWKMCTSGEQMKFVHCFIINVGMLSQPEVWKTRKSGSGSGTGTGQINECFKLGSVIRINTPPPVSTFLARWMMMIHGALLRKGTSTKSIVVIIFSVKLSLGSCSYYIKHVCFCL